MAAQRAPQPDLDPPSRPSLRLIHSVETPTKVAATPSAFRGLLWALGLSVVGFWAPVAAIVTYLFAR